MQRFLRRAVKASCQYAVIEMTSEGAKFYRHKWIELDALIFTNLAPEHIESHGSYEKYRDAKLSIARSLATSKKKRKTLIANSDDAEAPKFMAIAGVEKMPFCLSQAKPYNLAPEGLSMTVAGTQITSPLSGLFNIYNMLGAIAFAQTQTIGLDTIKRALEKFRGVRGRVERITMDLDPAGSVKQDFTVIVDYAHTPDSLQKLYDVFQNSKKICVLGNTGGGRDKWKRPAMAKIAEDNCEVIILTNEDPYDEDPQKIVEEMREAIVSKPVEIIMDRREAIAEALKHASTGDTVLITGKGTDPCICGPHGTKLPWSDSKVTREELEKLLSKK